MGKRILARRLASKFMVRFHMSLVLSATGATGVLASWVMSELGLQDLALRWTIATAAAYGAFFGFVRGWLRHITREMVPDKIVRKVDPVHKALDVVAATPQLARDTVGQIAENVDIETAADIADFLSSEGADGDHLLDFDASAEHDLVTAAATSSDNAITDSGGSTDLGDLDEGIALVLLLIVIAVVLGTAIYLIYQGPMILGEAALQFAMATGLIGPSRKLDQEDWMESVFKTTWKPFAIIMFLAFFAGVIVGESAPEAQSLIEGLQILSE